MLPISFFTSFINHGMKPSSTSEIRHVRGVLAARTVEQSDKSKKRARNSIDNGADK